MYVRMTQITPAIRLHRNRFLPIIGTVLVRQGQKVNSSDIVAEASLPSRHLLVDVVRAFGLSNPKLAESMIKRKAGESIGENDILAESLGLFIKIIRMTEPGKIISIRNGQVLIETKTETLSLKANYSGIISGVFNNRGVVIETSGALIQGAWGNGKTAVGHLFCKAESKSSELEFNSLDINARGAIIVGGVCTNPEIFSIASTLPIAGMIIGTIPASLQEYALKQSYPVLIVDGFGQSGMNSLAWKLLSTNNNHEITLNASFPEALNESRPEALISLTEEIEKESTASLFTKGQLVRIHTAPFMGQTGTVEKILPGLTTLTNGLRVCAVSVIVDNKERKTIPIANLDVIGFTN